MSVGNRVCPQCGNATTGLMCPIDGWATVPAAIVSEARLKPGSTLLGAFRVGAFLEDDGAMAIYGGSRIDNGRPVRIATIILPPSASLPEIARMQRSAHKLEEVKHPAIAQVLASGTTDRGDLAIVSEFVEGPTLTELLRGGELGPDRALSLGIGLFEALEAAHAAGIAHHDLSPERIRMAPGRVVVCDFGLADILRTPRSGMPWGTGEGEVPLLSRGLPYRAPEQARDRTVTKQADIYAVGAILYEALTGRPLFNEKSSADYLIAHMMKAPTAPAPRGDIVFDGLSELIMKCLEKKPWHRPESASVAREVLEDLRGRSVEAMALHAGRPVPMSRRAQRPVVLEVIEEGRVGSPPVADVEAATERAAAAMAIAASASAIAESAGSLVETANQVIAASRTERRPTDSGLLAKAAALAPSGAASAGPSGLLSIAALAQAAKNEAADSQGEAPMGLPVDGPVPVATRGTGRPAAIMAAEESSKPLPRYRAERSRWGLALVAGLVVGLGAVGVWYALGDDASDMRKVTNVARVEREHRSAPPPAVEAMPELPANTERPAATVAVPLTAPLASPPAPSAVVEVEEAVDGRAPSPSAPGSDATRADAEQVKRAEREALAKAERAARDIGAASTRAVTAGRAQLEKERLAKLSAEEREREVAAKAEASRKQQEERAARAEANRKLQEERAAKAEEARRPKVGANVAGAAQDADALRAASEEAEARRAAARMGETRRENKAERVAEDPKTGPVAPRPVDDSGVRRALLSSVPAGAAVLVDGKPAGRTPLTLTWAPNTTASVWVTLAGYEPANFQVGEKQHSKMIRLQLTPLPGTAAESAP